MQPEGIYTISQLRLFPKDIFSSEHLNQDLAGRSVRGGATTITSQGIMFALDLIRTVVLARLLTPEDFGLIGMVTVVIAFAAMFKDAGLSMATVQKDYITPGQISTLFWINLLVSLVIGFGVIAIAPLVATFYGRPELTTVTGVLSLSLIIQGVTIQHDALLRRHMRFLALAVAHIVASGTALVVAIILALSGWSYWALVGSTIAASLMILLMTFFFCPWVPGKIQKGTGVRSMLRFGGHVTVFNFFNYFTRNADKLLIGKFFGANTLGLYAQAYRIVQLPIQNLRIPITQVAIPACSRIQDNHEQIRSYARKYTFLLAFFCMPLMMFAFVFSKDLILVALGEQWIPMDPIFKILALVGFIQTPANVKGMMLLSCGKSKQYMKQGVAASIIISISFIIGIKWGAVGVASAFAISLYFIQFPTFWYTCKHTPLIAKDFISSISRPALVGIVIGIAFWHINPHFSFNSPMIKLIVISIAFIVSYLFIFMIIPGGFLIIKRDLIGVFRKGFDFKFKSTN